MNSNRRFNEQQALRFRQFTRKSWALFACLGRVVTIGVLSVATLESASAATDDVTTKVEKADNDKTDKEMMLDDLEVTGTLAPLTTGQTVRIVTVLSREEIQAAPVQSVNDLLKLVAAVDVRQRGPLGAQTDVSIRGGTQEQIVILLNGINICNPQTGHNTFDIPCDINDIQRIEVVEGPAGRAFGASSLQGAINIITYPTNSENDENKKHNDVRLRLEGGSFGYCSSAARTQFDNHVLSASYTRSDGYSRSLAGALNSDYKGTKAYYQGETDNDDIKLRWCAGISNKGFGSNTFYSAKYDEQYENTTRLITSLQGETKGIVHLCPAVYWNRSYDRFELIRGSESKVPFNHHRTDVFGVNVNAYADWKIGRTAIGAEFRNEDIVSSNLGEPLVSPYNKYRYGQNRSHLSFHAEHNLLLRNVKLSAGFIAIKNTSNEMPFSLYPGIDTSWRVGDCLKLYASYNESLRMPSFTELYYSVGGHKADKLLKPEEMRAVELGVKYTSRLVKVQTSVFRHNARNLIDWIMDTRENEPEWQSVNHTKIITMGEEINVDYRSGNVAVCLAYCHLHQQKDEQPYIQSQYSLEYLRNKLTTRLSYHFNKNLNATLNCRYHDRTGSYTDVKGNVRDYKPYFVADIRLQYDNRRYAVYTEMNNLTATHYVDYGNVTQPGCWFTVGACYNFPLTTKAKVK